MTKKTIKPLELAVEQRSGGAAGTLRYAFRVTVVDELQWDRRAEGIRFRLADAMGCPVPPGKPEIPAVTLECAAPVNTEKASIRDPQITYEERRLEGVIAPVARKTIRQDETSGSDPFRRDPSVYDAGGPFPPCGEMVQLVEPPLLHTRFPCPGISLLSIRVYLVLFDPREKRVRFPSRFAFELELEIGGAAPEWFGESVRHRADAKGFWSRVLDLSFGGRGER